MSTPDIPKRMRGISVDWLLIRGLPFWASFYSRHLESEPNPKRTQKI
jgi:hypothetical protein